MDVIVEEAIPKRRAGENANDEPFLNDLERYRVDQFLAICDTTYQSLTQSFNSEENNDLIKETQTISPH